MNEIENLPGEEWREIEGYYGQYLVSNMGRVKSLKGSKERLLQTFANNKGYPRVALCYRGQDKRFLVSRLVAKAFCGNPDPINATTVDHIDGDPMNNRADNLRWMSLSDNIKEAFRQRKLKQTENRQNPSQLS